MRVEKILGEHDWGFAIITTHTTFGQALQALRERRGQSRKEFGQHIQPSPWRADVVRKYEANQVDPGNLVILRICSAWDVTYLASQAGMAFLDNQP